MLAGRLISPFLWYSDVLRQYKEANVTLTEFGRFMAGPLERPSVRPPRRQFGDGGITVGNLTLNHAPSARPALNDVSFTLPPQGRFALVGRNSSGKSSLIRVLLGLQRGYAGDVTLAGFNLRHYDPRALRAHVGIVDQDAMLFSGTVRDNIAAGLAGVDDASVPARWPLPAHSTSSKRRRRGSAPRSRKMPQFLRRPAPAARHRPRHCA